MAITYTVAELRKGRSIGFAGTKDKVSVNWTTQYSVIVTDPADSGFNAATDIGPYEVVTASGLPTVNASVYYFQSQVIPFVICRSKTAVQDPQHAALWTVTCKYTGERNAPEDPPTNLTDFAPQVVSELGEIPRVLYEDKSTPPKVIKLPSGHWWAEPAIERVPTLTLKITQYEASVTYEQMLARKFKVNKTAYRGQPRYDWLIENVEANEVTVHLAAGATTAAQVTYTVSYNPLQHGWKDDRVLADTHKLDTTTGKFVPAHDGELRDVRNIFITETGELHTGLPPKYIQYETFDDIDFGSFLQV